MWSNLQGDSPARVLSLEGTLMSLRSSPSCGVAAVLFAVSAPLAAATTDAAVEEAFQSIQRAVEARDVAALRRLVHPRFEMLHAFGQVDRYDIWLTLVAGGKLPRQTSDIREYNRTISRVGEVAIRSSVVRFRDPKGRRDSWLRGSTTFVFDDGRWRQLRHQSALLHEAPSADAARLGDYVGDYSIPKRDGFRLIESDGLLSLEWTTGARLPLVPIGPDHFGAGPLSTMRFTRGPDGKVATAVRGGPEGPWWTATRADDDRR